MFIVEAQSSIYSGLFTKNKSLLSSFCEKPHHQHKALSDDICPINAAGHNPPKPTSSPA
jgi:hypothetical protein